jgi:predicted AAA+ superfamily ATPase
VSPTTVREYYRILEDTLVGYLVEPLRKPSSRKEVSTAKFYFFDTGVANTLRSIKSIEEGTPYFGEVFEQFIGQEIRAALSYQRIHEPLRFWRTHTQHEVDFIVGDLLAVEVKSSTGAGARMIKGLRQLGESFPIKHRCLISRDPVERMEDGIVFLPYQKFLSRLWNGDWFV